MELGKLNTRQKQAVLSTNKRLMLIAGAGTGKTSTIINKMKYLIIEKGVQPQNILAVTFTNKAVNEIKERLNNKLVEVSTFHELARKIVFDKENYRKLNYQNLSIISDENKNKTLEELLERSEYFVLVNQYKVTVKKLLQDFTLIKNDLYIKSNNEEYEEMIEFIFNAYNLMLSINDLIEVDDLITLAYDLLKKDKELLNYYQNRYTHIFIDEYQDINKSQYKLMKLIIANNNVTVVGDEDQSIYSWRGSNRKYFTKFETEYENVEVIKLEENYRSTKEILNLANTFIKENKDRIDKNLYTERKGTRPIICTSNQLENQVNFTLDKILDYSKEYRYKDNAILIRNKNVDLMLNLKRKLIEKRIPYTIVGEFPLLDRKIIKDLISVLKFIENRKNNYSLKRLTYNLSFGLGKTFYKNLDDIRKNLGIYSYYEIIKNHKKYHNLSRYKKKIDLFLERFKKYEEEKNFLDLIEEVIEDFFSEADVREFTHIKEFEQQARVHYTHNGYQTIKEYLNYIEYFKEEYSKDTLQIMTMHASKGLEFENIYILNLSKNYPFLFKTNYMKLEKDILADNNILEEERRLLYVAMTRAKSNLYLLGENECRFLRELNSILQMM